jgi:membrane fusion protein, copper/silver efflux system
MRRLLTLLLVVGGLAGGALTVVLVPDHHLFVDGVGHHAGHDHGTVATGGSRYACPMICFIGAAPGTCPVCGMTMTPVKADELNREQAQRIGLETTVVRRGPATMRVRGYGVADYDNRLTKMVVPRVAGRIVERYEATYGCCSDVAAGDPIIELYSVDVITAQGELQAALRLGDRGLIDSLVARFARWNLQSVADAVLRGEPIQETATIHAPFAGVVYLLDEEMVNEELAVGREVQADTILLRLVDPDWLVLVVHVPEHRARWLREGQRVAISTDDHGALPQIDARISRLANEINPQLRTREVRVHLRGVRHLLLPGMLVDAHFEVGLGPDLQPADPADAAALGNFVLVPKSAVLSTGVRHVAWRVARRGSDSTLRFEIAPLALGPRIEDAFGNDWYVVRAGLAEGDEVATQGAFLIDSQSQLAGTPSLLYPLGAVPADGGHSSH